MVFSELTKEWDDMGQFYLGIDNGGSWIKVVIFDRKGKEILKEKAPLPMDLSVPGFTERDMEQLWNINCQVIHTAVTRLGAGEGEIRGVGFSGHGKGLYLLDEAGRPCAGGIVSTDSRGNSVAEQWRREGVEKQLFPRILQPLVGCQPLCLIKWFQKNEPEVWARARWVFGVKDYLRFRMTGRAAAEITDFSGSGLVNLRMKRYDREILTQTGLLDAEEKLPPLLWPYEPAGTVTKEAARVTGIPEGTVCSAGAFDIDSCAIGMGLTSENGAAVIAGTWGINEYICKEPVTDRPDRKNSLFAIPGYYLVEESSPASAGNLDYILKLLFEDNWTYPRINELAAGVERGCRGLYFYPFLFGDYAEKAAFCGLSAGHTKAHMIRSVMEGVAFYHRIQLERLFSGRQFPEKDFSTRKFPGQILLGGGILGSPLWTQIFADVLNCPVAVTDCEETGALGAAMTAAAACKDQKDLLTAAYAMAGKKTVIVPEKEGAAVYAEHFGEYKRLYQKIYIQEKEK